MKKSSRYEHMEMNEQITAFWRVMCLLGTSSGDFFFFFFNLDASTYMTYNCISCKQSMRCTVVYTHSTKPVLLSGVNWQFSRSKIYDFSSTFMLLSYCKLWYILNVSDMPIALNNVTKSALNNRASFLKGEDFDAAYRHKKKPASPRSPYLLFYQFYCLSINVAVPSELFMELR